MSDEWGMNPTSSRNFAGALLGCPAAQKVRPQTQVEAHTSEIEREIERLEKSLDIHAEKLQSVLRVTDQAPCAKECEPPEEMLVPSADKLRSIRKQLTRLRLALEDLTERTEA